MLLFNFHTHATNTLLCLDLHNVFYSDTYDFVQLMIKLFNVNCFPFRFLLIARTVYIISIQLITLISFSQDIIINSFWFQFNDIVEYNNKVGYNIQMLNSLTLPVYVCKATKKNKQEELRFITFQKNGIMTLLFFNYVNMKIYLIYDCECVCI